MERRNAAARSPVRDPAAIELIDSVAARHGVDAERLADLLAVASRAPRRREKGGERGGERGEDRAAGGPRPSDDDDRAGGGSTTTWSSSPVEVAADLGDRVALFRGDLGIDAARVVRGLGRGGRGRVRTGWAWRPLVELRTIVDAWRRAGESHLLVYGAEVVLGTGGDAPAAGAGDDNEPGAGDDEDDAAAPDVSVALAMLEAVVTLRREEGLEDDDLRKILRQNHHVLCHGRGVVTILDDLADRLGLERSAVARLVRRWPSVLSVTPDKIDEHLRLFGSSSGGGRGEGRGGAGLGLSREQARSGGTGAGGGAAVPGVRSEASTAPNVAPRRSGRSRRCR